MKKTQISHPLRLTIKMTSFVLVIWFLFFVSIQGPYQEYESLITYRRLHPEFITPPSIARYIAVGHDTTYADITWLQTIQYIGDNIGNGGYINFTNTLIRTINALHPYFSKPYETSLLLAPVIASYDTGSVVTEKIKGIRDSILIGEDGITHLCATGS